MLRLALLLVALAAPLRAEPPRVLTDIAPVHSLVASVMSGVATPDLLLPPGIAPHDYALRPSDAARIAESDLIFWVGPGLTPWLAEGLATVAVKSPVWAVVYVMTAFIVLPLVGLLLLQ